MCKWLRWCHLADHPGDALAKSAGGFDPASTCRDELAVIVAHLRSMMDQELAA